MVATYTTSNALRSAERRMCDFDPNTTNDTLVTLNPAASEKCLPLMFFRRYVATLFRSVGTGSVTSFKIIAATDAAGTGNTAVVAHPLTSDPNAVGDYIFLEADVDQVLEVLPGASHVGVEIALGTNTDECVIGFERLESMHSALNVSSDFIQ